MYIQICDTIFTWNDFELDNKKADSNYRKHGIRFEEAMQVFDDPFSILAQDRIENGELRWQAIV